MIPPTCPHCGMRTAQRVYPGPETDPAEPTHANLPLVQIDGRDESEGLGLGAAAGIFLGVLAVVVALGFAWLAFTGRAW